MKNNKFLLKMVLIYFSIIVIFIISVPLIHDWLVDMIDIGDYEIKSGIITDVYKKKKGNNLCQYIKIDGYDIFVVCGESEYNFNIGDNSDYYTYNGNAYYTKAQMQSSNNIVKILDIGMLASFFIMLIFAIFFIPIYLEIAKRKNKIIIKDNYIIEVKNM